MKLLNKSTDLTHNNYDRDGSSALHGFFMAIRRLTCPERLERKNVIITENRNLEETII